MGVERATPFREPKREALCPATIMPSHWAVCVLQLDFTAVLWERAPTGALTTGHQERVPAESQRKQEVRYTRKSSSSL